MTNFTTALIGTLHFFKKHSLLILAILMSLLSFLLCAYYIIYPAEGYLHSDCTDSLLWANASVESGEVFDDNFRYAAMLPFGASLWFIPLIHLFGYSMTAQTVGMLIFLLLFTLAAYFMCRSLEWSHTASLCMISAMLLMLSGSDKLREIMWGHVIYYSLALLIIMVSIGLAARLSRHLSNALSPECENRKPAIIKSSVYALLMFLLLAGNATNGFQLIAMSTLALFAAIFAERFFDGSTKLFSRKNIPAAAILALIGISSVIGLKILDLLKGDKITNYTTVYSSFSAIEDWYTNFAAFFKNYFSLLGVVAKKGTPLFEKESIPSLVRLVGGIVLLVVPVIALLRYKHIRSKGTKIILWTHLAVSAVILFGVICGRLGNTNWRLTPMVGTAIMSTVAAARELLSTFSIQEKTADHVTQFRVGLVLCAVLIVFSATNANEIRSMPKDYGRDNALHQLTDTLEEKGLEYGYATFWRSQAITLLSDSKVKCRETLINSKGVITDFYQSSRLWYEDQPGVEKYFLILSKSEYETVYKTAHWKKIMNTSYVEHFTCAGYRVYVFDDNIILLGEFEG